jgi:hypothetical protein
MDLPFGIGSLPNANRKTASFLVFQDTGVVVNHAIICVHSRQVTTVGYGGDLGHLGGYSCGYRAPAFRIHGPWDMK